MQRLCWRKCLLLLCSVAIISLFSNVVLADLSYYDVKSQSQWIATDGSTPVWWARLNFPDSLTGTYSNGQFEYDGYSPNYVDFLTIKLRGHGDDSSYPINMWIDFDGTHNNSNEILLGSKDVQNSIDFTLEADIKGGAFYYTPNGGARQKVSDITNVGLASFVGKDEFWVGYACHFYHDYARVDVGVTPTPEPATMLLVGTGLVGLAGLGRRRFNRAN